MKKILFRTAVLTLLFVSVFFLTYKTIKEHSSGTETTAFAISESTLPIVSFYSGGNEINQTIGYTVSRDELCPRDSITPISTEKKFGILIKQKRSSVKSVTVEVFDIPGLISLEKQEQVSTVSNEDGRLFCEIVLDSELSTNVEYMCVVTLLDSDGDRIYYYTRLLVADFGSLSGSLEFIKDFHTKTFDKSAVYELDEVMESDDGKPVTDYSHIDISADLESLSYGEMVPEELYCMVPTITEYNSSYVAADMLFWLQCYTEEGLENYKCRENYRIKYTVGTTYLLDYDRYMDQIFAGNQFNMGTGEMQLGICSDRSVDSITSENGKMAMFSYQGTLWLLDTEAGSLTELLTYKERNDFDRSSESEYGFTLLKVEDTGDADFAVCGYIGKGAYEGRSGIIYYHYYAGDARLEEEMFIPVNLQYDELKNAFGKVCYTSDLGIFYFTLFDAYYSFELDTKILKTEIEDLGDNWLYFPEESIMVYNENPDPALNRTINLLNVKENKTVSVHAGYGQTINLLGTTDNNIVYGSSSAELLSFYDNGETMVPFTGLTIMGTDRSKKEEYTAPEGKYICSVKLDPTLISLMLYDMASPADGEKKAQYTYSSSDVILNLNVEKTLEDKYGTSYSELTKTGYYYGLTDEYTPERLPELKSVDTTKVKMDTSALIPVKDKYMYTVYACGSIALITEDAGLAVNTAASLKGSVTDEYGNVMWRYGLTDKESFIDIDYMASDSTDCRRVILLMLMAHRDMATDGVDFDFSLQSFFDYFRDEMGPKTSVAEKLELDNLKYYISHDRPVIMSYEDRYVLIYGYTSSRFYFYDPWTDDAFWEYSDDAVEIYKNSGEVCYFYY